MFGLRLTLFALVMLGLVGLPSSFASEPDSDLDVLLDLSLEELMNVKVTSASKKVQALNDVPAAIQVLTSEDLRRSGATTIPDALRMVPGMHVGRIDSNEWAVSSRGFNSRFANKMLVLIDGRSNYASLFSGVFWESMDIPFDEIERVEVIRGPGATVWGANAVNGVVNIITKHAKDSQGLYTSSGYGTEERGFANFRYGHRLSDHAHLRVFGKYANRDHGAGRNGFEATDAWETYRTGFRFDWQTDANNAFMLQGDIRDADAAGTTQFAELEPPYSSTVESSDPLRGQSLFARWSHSFHKGNDLTLQAYWDHYEPGINGIFQYEASVLDFEAVHQMSIATGHELVSGLEYRSYSDKVDGSFDIDFASNDEWSDLFSTFLQYEVRPSEEKFVATIGSKFENHRSSQWEAQPNLRFLYQPWARHSFWASVSKAVRTPSRAEESAQVHLATVPPDPSQPGAPATVVTFTGNPDFRSEKLTAFELGHRSRLRENLHVDVSTFYNFYDDLRAIEAQTPTLVMIEGTPYVLFQQKITNGLTAEARGVELTFNLRPSTWWRMNASYSYLDMVTELPPIFTELAALDPRNEHPKHQFSIHGAFDPIPPLDMDVTLRYVDEVKTYDIDSYLVGDMRVAWNWDCNLSLALVGRDLLEKRHSEYGSEILNTIPTDVESSIYAMIEWKP